MSLRPSSPLHPVIPAMQRRLSVQAVGAYGAVLGRQRSQAHVAVDITADRASI